MSDYPVLSHKQFFCQFFCQLFEKVSLLGVKEFDGLQADLKIIWRRTWPLF